jgi:hypothetical protein
MWMRDVRLLQFSALFFRATAHTAALKNVPDSFAHSLAVVMRRLLHGIVRNMLMGPMQEPQTPLHGPGLVGLKQKHTEETREPLALLTMESRRFWKAFFPLVLFSWRCSAYAYTKGNLAPPCIGPVMLIKIVTNIINKPCFAFTWKSSKANCGKSLQNTNVNLPWC